MPWSCSIVQPILSTIPYTYHTIKTLTMTDLSRTPIHTYIHTQKHTHIHARTHIHTQLVFTEEAGDDLEPKGYP